MDVVSMRDGAWRAAAGRAAEPPVLDVLAAADAAVVAARLAERSARWARRFGPPFDPALAPLCSLPAAFVAPWLTPAGADLTARTGLWIFALDAWTDGPAARRDPGRLRAGLDRLRTAVRGGAPAAGHGPGDVAALVTALTGLGGAVAASPAVLPRWRRAVDAALAGALFEYEAARQVASGGPAPSIEEYLRHAARSIALAPLVLAMWSDMTRAPAGPAPDPPGVPLRVLHGPLQDAALAVRLANDLRGHHREREEGVLDVLTLGLTPDETRERIALHVDRCRTALRPYIGPAPGPALALERQLLWSVRHYERTDAGHAA